MVTANNKRANLDQSTYLTGEGLRATHLDIKCLTVDLSLPSDAINNLYFISVT